MKRASGTTSKSSSLSRHVARKAVLGVMAKRSSSAAKKTGGQSSKKASPTFVERYLGHFGVGSTSSAVKRSGAKKTSSAKKSSAKKSSASKSHRRAS